MSETERWLSGESEHLVRALRREAVAALDTALVVRLSMALHGAAEEIARLPFLFDCTAESLRAGTYPATRAAFGDEVAVNADVVYRHDVTGQEVTVGRMAAALAEHTMGCWREQGARTLGKRHEHTRAATVVSLRAGTFPRAAGGLDDDGTVNVPPVDYATEGGLHPRGRARAILGRALRYGGRPVAPVTAARAQEIELEARGIAMHGPWSDQIDGVILPHERAYVIDVWGAMPGYTCFVDAFHRIARGEDEAPPATERHPTPDELDRVRHSRRRRLRPEATTLRPPWRRTRRRTTTAARGRGPRRRACRAPAARRPTCRTRAARVPPAATGSCRAVTTTRGATRRGGRTMVDERAERWASIFLTPQDVARVEAFGDEAYRHRAWTEYVLAVRALGGDAGAVRRVLWILAATLEALRAGTLRQHTRGLLDDGAVNRDQPVLGGTVLAYALAYSRGAWPEGHEPSDRIAPRVARGAAYVDEDAPRAVAVRAAAAVRAQVGSALFPRRYRGDVRLDPVYARLAGLTGEARREAMRRASCSYSAPAMAVQRGGRIDGDEVVWPDGERYPIRTPESPLAEGKEEALPMVESDY